MWRRRHLEDELIYQMKGIPVINGMETHDFYDNELSYFYNELAEGQHYDKKS